MSTRGTSSFRASWRVQIRVVKALIQRSFISLSGGKGIGFLGVMLEPMLFMLGLTSLFLIRSSTTGFISANISPIAFAVSGYCILWACRFQITKSIAAISSNINLLYHRNVKVLDLLISRAIVQACFITFGFLVILFWVVYLELIPEPNNYLLIFVSWILVQWYGFNLAIFGGTVSAYSNFGNKIVLVVNISHFFITGMFFMVAWIPQEYREMVLWFPMVHATEMMRDGFFGQNVQTYYDPVYVIAINSVVSCLSLCFVQVYKHSEDVYGKG
ncbi:ABC transporter permease [Desulfolutivibrio sulfoxidireducens]|uniref:ABC transporter permease n=1 Tax=Desulfolutivibrio sulfoxidireducens TaxID=2773299 RepID=UPI00159D61F2|nr:ABC transporter permease [Desulfolutivibrio sulfoxidireducens]QLA15309.1 hypothetical protein GD605_03715 [Desulfolutivibrio sulfoxidireducens]QLA18885.1 hypothetical protein GD604_03630 [Desulfolutivibrio sulfoxidireducens]